MTIVYRRPAVVAVAAGLLLGAAASACSDQDEPRGATVDPTPTELADLPLDTVGYVLDVETLGVGPRAMIREPVPVGRVETARLVICDTGQQVRVELVAEVVEAAADGSSQTVRLTIDGAEADDPEVERGLIDAVGASAEIVRDGAGAVVGERIDLPDELGLRARTVGELALRAPFFALGPWPDNELSAGARWRTVFGLVGVDRSDPDRTVEADLVTLTPNGRASDYELRLAGSPDAVITGTTGRLLPSRQIMTIDGLDVRVESPPAG